MFTATVLAIVMSHTELEVSGSSGSIVLKLVLHNVVQDSKAVHDFTCEQQELDLTTVSQVKEYVEAKHSIPVCYQTLFFQSRKLRDQDTLTQCWLREQDTIVVKYESEANVEDVLELLNILKYLIHKLEVYMTTGNSFGSLLNITERLEKLMLASFDDITPISDANRLLLVDRGGIEVFYTLYGLILKHDYQDTIFQIRHLESKIVGVVSDMLIYAGAKKPLLEKFVLETPTLEYVHKSFTRVLVPWHQRVVAPAPPKGEWWSATVSEQDSVLATCLHISLINISK